MRSKIPPCPGIKLPLSLISRSRFTEEITTSPKNPETLIMKPNIRPSSNVNGVNNGAAKPEQIVIVITAPKKPSQVLFGLTFGIILFRPNNLPQIY